MTHHSLTHPYLRNILTGLDQTMNPVAYQDLIDHYLRFDQLQELLLELPQQWADPQTRSWSPIDWQAIAFDQIVGIPPEMFLAVIAGSATTEAPIRGYARTSRSYMEPVHPLMARYVGGLIDSDGTVIELGLWEKEERRHTPSLNRIYAQLKGETLKSIPRSVRLYQPSGDPFRDLYWHGLHRIATEYGAVCLYLWLMTHSTGVLYQVLSELLQDEINHLIKFWGFGIWAYPQSALHHLRTIVSLMRVRKRVVQQSMDLRSTNLEAFDSKEFQDLSNQASLTATFGRMMGVLAWSEWPIPLRFEFVWISSHLLVHLTRWSLSLRPEDLNAFLGTPPLPLKSPS